MTAREIINECLTESIKAYRHKFEEIKNRVKSEAVDISLNDLSKVFDEYCNSEGLMKNDILSEIFDAMIEQKSEEALESLVEKSKEIESKIFMLKEMDKDKSKPEPDKPSTKESEEILKIKPNESPKPGITPPPQKKGSTQIANETKEGIIEAIEHDYSDEEISQLWEVGEEVVRVIRKEVERVKMVAITTEPIN